MARRPHVLVYDSGLGGLSVARALHRLGGGHVCLSYLADTGGFPYGDWPEITLRKRILALMHQVMQTVRPDVVVIACNTATVTALAPLRSTFAVPFVGTVPAIKPAAHATKSGIIGVLATPSTVRREYTEMLIHTYAYHHRVVLHGAPHLARLAERRLSGEPVAPEDIAAEIAPAFLCEGDGRRTDVLVLGCTHYPLIREDIEAAAPWPVTIIDPSPAIARRALEVAATCHREMTETCKDHGPDRPAGWVTDAAGQDRLGPILVREGFSPVGVLDLPERDRP